MPDEDGEGASREGLLITETVVPGFEYSDHEFLGRERLEGLVGGRGRGSWGDCCEMAVLGTREREWLMECLRVGLRNLGLH